MIAVILAMMLLVMSGCEEQPSADSLQVYMMDLGEADCFILTQGSHAMLIDAGLAKDEDRVVSFASECGIDRFDYVLMTHPHADHIGGFEKVFEEFEVGEFWYAEVPDELVERTLLHERMEHALDENGAFKREVSSGLNAMLGSAAVTVYPIEDEYDDANDYSVVCRISFAEKSLLMTGDATSARLHDLSNSGFDLSADVLKLPHHGSNGSYHRAFFKAVSPQYALLSCGTDNSQNHPGDKMMDSDEMSKVTTYRTDRHGNVKMSISRDGIFFEVSR